MVEVGNECNMEVHMSELLNLFVFNFLIPVLRSWLSRIGRHPVSKSSMRLLNFNPPSPVPADKAIMHENLATNDVKLLFHASSTVIFAMHLCFNFASCSREVS